MKELQQQRSNKSKEIVTCTFYHCASDIKVSESSCFKISMLESSEKKEASSGIFCPFHAMVQEKMEAIIVMKKSSNTLGQIHYFKPEIILESVNLDSKVKLALQDFSRQQLCPYLHPAKSYHLSLPLLPYLTQWKRHGQDWIIVIYHWCQRLGLQAACVTPEIIK